MSALLGESGSALVALAALGAAGLLVLQVLAPPANRPVLESRTFLGAYRVEQDQGRYVLISGSTRHGAQDPARPDEPLSYYTRGGPVGQVMATYGTGADEVGLVGLGVGALAAYGQGGQRFTGRLA